MTAVAPSAHTAALKARLEAAWRRSDQIFSLLTDAAWYERPIALRQPFIFYVGHLPAFAWNQVARGLLARPGFNPAFDALFARGIDPVGVDRYEPDSPTLWPAPGEVLAYRDQVRETLRASFDDVAALEGTDVLADRGRVWQLVIEHEVMHAETLLYMVQQLPMDLKTKPDGMAPYRLGCGAPAAEVPVPGGEVVLGADFDAVDFGWDNEFPRTAVTVGDFTVDRCPVRNIEFLEFVEAGGYATRALWDAEAWAWRERVQHTHPVFWRRVGGAWLYRTLFDEFPLTMAAEWPVPVSCAEAQAYARWRGRDLMTEAEYHRAAEGAPFGDPAKANIDFTNWAPTPVGLYGEGASRHGVLDLVGNGWEWTRTRFAPFPGFTPWARTYPGYSADFFDEHHYVMLGGSFASEASLTRRSFRNWFQPHYPYVFSQFRTVRRA